MPRLFVSFAIFTALLAAPALAAQTLDGWGAYKFGMSPDAARAVPGMPFGPYAAKNLWNENKGAMGAQKKATLYAQPFALNLFFDSREKLNAISLENEKTSSQAACEKTFLGFLGHMEKSYGGFLAVNPERKRNDSDTPPTSLEWRAQGASHYQFVAVSFVGEYAFVWKARKVIGGNYVDLSSTWSAGPNDPSAPCITGIDYHGRG
jgi:hypothetical protein